MRTQVEITLLFNLHRRSLFPMEDCRKVLFTLISIQVTGEVLKTLQVLERTKRLLQKEYKL